jgi:hypothetical protein
MTEPAGYDWVKGQALYEAGLVSLAKIARELGCSDSAVALRANRYGWLRDPGARAKVVAEREEIMAKQVKEERTKIVAVTAHMQSTVLVRHRTDIQRARAVVSSLLDELTEVTSNKQVFQDLGELMHSPDDRGIDRLNAAYKKIISLPERASTLNTLSTALKTLIMLERHAYSIEGRLEDPEAERPQEDVVKGLDKIMDKFNQVLALQVQPAAAPLTEVIDVPTTTPRATTASAV